MIYFIYEKQNLIAETDNLEFVKTVMKKHPGCLAKELGTGKVFKLSYPEQNISSKSINSPCLGFS